MVGGVSSDVKDTRSRPPAHQPTKQYFMDMKIKILIYSRFSKGILRHSNAYIFRLVFYIIGDQNMIE
jgi:hypothetical protein